MRCRLCRVSLGGAGAAALGAAGKLVAEVPPLEPPVQQVQVALWLVD